MTEIEHPDWIAEGTEVLTFNTGNSLLTSLRKSVITKVTKTQFAIHGDEKRFKIANEPGRHDGGTWGWTKRVIPLSSDEAHGYLEQRRAQHFRNKAQAACDAYSVRQSKENRLAAITALQAVTEDVK